MGLSYDEAVSTLYRAPFESFVSERKRLAGELKGAGDKSGAAQFAKLGRPPISAWAVNQLWWQARQSFDELFETAAELRKGKLAASAAHRKALARLGARAQQLLSEGGHSANDATLRRVTMTLSALAAAGNFEPDAPGALSKDREPPGFEAFGIASSSEEQSGDEPAAPELDRNREAEAAATERKHEAEAERKREAAVAERQREAEAEAAAAERKRAAEAQAKRDAQRKKLEGELADAKVDLAEREQERDRIEKQLTTAEREVERARAEVAAAQAKLETE